MKIRSSSKLVFLWCAVVLFALCNAAGWFWLHDRNYQKEYLKYERETQMANRAFVEQTAQVINQADTLLRAVRGYHLRSKSTEDVESFISEILFSNSFVEQIYLIDSNGYIVAPIADQSKEINLKQRDYFQFHASTPNDTLYVGPVDKSKITNKMQFPISRRINKPDGSFGGVILTPIEPNAFAEYYHRLLPSSDNAAVLVGSLDHRIRARSPIPEPSSDLWARPLDSKKLWDSFAKSPSGSYRGLSVIDSIERQFIYDQVNNLPLVIVTGFSDQDVRQSVAKQMPVITFAAMSATVVIIMMASILTIIYCQRDLMQELAMIDALTGIFNRRHLMAVGLSEAAQAQRFSSPLSLIMLDIDFFKKINDAWGHPAGDRVLQAMSKVMVSVVRSQDIVGRLGGEEFLIILPQTNASENYAIAERIRLLIEECQEAKADDGAVIRFKVSIGAVTLANSDKSFDALLSRVDKALYQAKESGRNRVVVG